MRLLLILLTFCALLPAAFDPHAWATRRLVQTSLTPFEVAVITPSMYEDSQAQLRDLRLMCGAMEVPYVIKTLDTSREERSLPASMMDKAAVPGVGVQVVFNVGQSSPHDRVTIHTNRTNFKQRVRIETRDDGGQWGVVRRDGVVFDVSSADYHAAGLSVSYPVSTRSLVRVTIEGWTEPTWLQSASISFVREIAAQRDLAADLRPAVAENSAEHMTILNFDLGFARPYDRIEFEISPGLFSRETTILTSSDRKTWSGAGYATLARSATQEVLTAEIPEHWQRYVRAEIRNLDNAPLVVSGARFKALRRELIFESHQAGLCWLYSGNPTAEQPRYDLANILPESPDMLEAKVGEPQRNPAYQPPTATGKSTWLLTGVLFLLVPAMGAMAFKMLRQIKPAA